MNNWVVMKKCKDGCGWHEYKDYKDGDIPMLMVNRMRACCPDCGAALKLATGQRVIGLVGRWPFRKEAVLDVVWK